MKMLNFNQNRNTKVIKVLSLSILMIILLSVTNSFATTYYSRDGKDPSSTTSWRTGTTSGSYPSSFNNTGDLFVIQSGQSMTMSNNWTIAAQLQLNSGSTLYINGMTLTYNGNAFTNNGSVIGTTAGSNLSIGGTGAKLNIPALTLYKLTLNRSNGIMLTGNVTITNTLTLTNGILYTDNDTIFFASTANTPTETSTKKIEGTAVMLTRVIETGSFNFLGAYFAASNQSLGNVIITRKTGTVAIGNNNGNSSIACNWDIVAQNQPTNGRDMTYSWFSTNDNGNTFSSINRGQVYYSTDDGATWYTIGSLVNPVTSSTTRSITVNTTHYSRWTIGSENGPLPVSLSSFTSSVKLNSVTLNWSTASELNNKGFDIERKEINGNDYSKVGFVEGKGTTNQITNYSFTDSKLNAGKYSYRIKQVDFNGNFEYFSLNSGVEISTPKKFNLSQNYPNPFNPTTKIDYEIPADSKVQITIYDISGKEVMQVVNEQQKAGFYTAQFNGAKLSSGTYFYKLSLNGANGSEVLTKKMTLIK